MEELLRSAVVAPVRATKIRHVLTQTIRLGVVFATALIIWKGLVLVMGVESLAMMVVSGSMEPGFGRGDILFVQKSNDPIRTGEIIVFNVDGREIPIVHRVIKVHERRDTAEIDILTKGDNNPWDDRFLYANGQLWLQQHHIIGRVVGYLPYVGWLTIIMNENPVAKMLLNGRSATPEISWEM